MEHDAINPAHYKTSTMECIELVETCPFALGNALKYAWRYKFKGTPAQDLQKAKWYLNRARSTEGYASVEALTRAANEAPTTLVRAMCSVCLSGYVDDQLMDILTSLVDIAIEAEGE